MKIVILKGSPRVNGNSNLLVEQFVKGAEENGHKIIEFDCSKHKVGGCMAWETLIIMYQNLHSGCMTGCCII